ncbi:MAG TPA: hypothetical protein VLM89_14990 [Phycisphaerae bacterium]|nr:hypothetical protein [Phycisphaerae bacterium]
MGWVYEWLEATACPMLNRDQDERVQSLAREMGRFMRQEGRFFSLDETALMLGIQQRDLPPVQDRLYELTLRYVLQNYAITDRDRSGLRWVAKALRLPPDNARRIELRVGRRVFEQYLSFAIAGGFLDAEELQQLRSVADSLGVSTRHMLAAYLAESGEEFLERILSGMAEDGRITDAAWQRLLASTAALGLDKDEFLRILRPHANRLVDGIRTRVKPDGRPDLDLWPALQSLVSRFPDQDAAVKS